MKSPPVVHGSMRLGGSGPLLVALLLLGAGTAAALGTGAARTLPAPVGAEPGLAGPRAADASPWTNLTPSTGAGPPGALGAVLVNDSADGLDLWFGGSVAHAGGPIGLTWVDRNGTWSNLTATQQFSPPARSFPAAAYDPGLSSVVLFGGLAGAAYLNDTWYFHAGNWTNATSVLAEAPAARAEAAMATDPVLGGLLLFGGTNASGPLGDTWSLAAGHWNRLAPAEAPPSACCGALAFDSTDGYAVLTVADPGDAHLFTWTFSGGTWSNATGATGPSGRQWTALVDDPAVEGLVLYGGTALPRSPFWPLGDAWIFSAGRWTSAPGARAASGNPGPLWDAAVAPVAPANGCFLLVGGAGIDGAVAASAAVWSGCGNRTLWTNGSSTGSTGPNPPVLALSPDPLSGVIPFTTRLNITVRNGTAPFDLSVCTSLEGCEDMGSWSGSAPYLENVTFGAVGNYSVSAVVIDASGLSSSATASVSAVAPNPLVVVPSETPIDGTVPLTAEFTAKVSGGAPPYAVQWYFGDGSVGAGVTDVALAHVYDAVGTFYPTLVVTDARGAIDNVTLPAIAVHPVLPTSGNGNGSGSSGPSLTDAALILIGGVAIAAIVYALRRRRLRAVAEETIEEVRAPPEPPDEGAP